MAPHQKRVQKKGNEGKEHIIKKANTSSFNVR